MIVTDRLKACLKAQDLSQAELARRVGLQQSTVNLLFNGKSRTTTKLREIARELRTTPEYLEGLTDDPDSEVGQAALSFEERELIDVTRQLGRDDFNVLTYIARRLMSGEGSGSPPPVNDRRQPSLHDRQLGYRSG